MKRKYTGGCAEYEAAIVAVLRAGMEVTGDVAKRRRYAAAIEAIADARVEKAEAQIVSEYEVNVVRKSTVTVTAADEAEAERKAIAGLDVGEGESVGAEVAEAEVAE